MEWFYAKDGETVGPFTEEQFGNMKRNGVIFDDTLVWREGMAEWQALSVAGPEIAHLSTAGTDDSNGGTADRTPACCECGKHFPVEDMIDYEGQWVCAACKPVYFQRLAEGGVVPGTMFYAGFWIRAGAKIIDGLILGALNMVLGMGLGFLGGLLAAATDNEIFIIMSSIFASLIQLVIGLGYSTFLVGKYGATWGKMACGLKVVTAEGGNVSYARALGRTAAEYLSMLTCYIGYIMVAFDDEKRALHDHVCSTRVIRK
ncbi:MAG: RDD family protein [Lentisphaeria bacterium]|nr:RDD family protein [Lentisphaeria bacterium]